MLSFLDRVQAAGFLIVALTLIETFVIPPSYFKLGSIVSTVCMVCVTVLLVKYKDLFKPSLRNLGMGLASAALLYGIFLLGNFAIKNYSIPFLTVSSKDEYSIYSLIGGGPLYWRVVVLALDSVGFESYFRGNLLNYFRLRMRVGAAFLSAGVDALIHFSSFNPLFVITTLIADSAWGVTYYYTQDLSSCVLSHFVWDVAIFIVAPIR